MSRKYFEDKSEWKTASCYAITSGHGPFKFRQGEEVVNPIVWLVGHDDHDHGDESGGTTKNRKNRMATTKTKNESSASSSTSLSKATAAAVERHPLFPLTKPCKVLLQNYSPDRSIIVIDLRTMFDTPEEYHMALQQHEQVEIIQSSGGGGGGNETAAAAAAKLKRFKSVRMLLRRLWLKDATLVASKDLCPLALRLFLDVSTFSDLWLWYPALSTKCCNSSMFRTRSLEPRRPVHVCFENERMQHKRLDILRHAFPNGTHLIHSDPQTALCRCCFPEYYDSFVESIAVSCGNDGCDGCGDDGDDDNDDDDDDADLYNDVGHTLWFSSVTVEMSAWSKQYERDANDITQQVYEKIVIEGTTNATGDGNDDNTNSIDWLSAEPLVGALVLRGNRCVLARSQKDGSLFLPWVEPKAGENPIDAAARSVVTHIEVDEDEVEPVVGIPPVCLYYGPQGRRVLVYPLYARQPPPDGPLEDQDMEDDETPYDWYTFPNAEKKVSPRIMACLRTFACSLMEAARVSLLPAKWGGVFGQEFIPDETIAVEPWKHDVLHAVREAMKVKTKQANPQSAPNSKPQTSRDGKRLPVTILSGFLGSGKSTLMGNLLANSEGLKIAVLVNDMGEVNIDAALLKKSVSIHQQEEHLVELSNGCICCTLREDLLTAVAQIAAKDVDYLLVESSGISEPLPVAETFTFEDDSGLALNHVAFIDTLVTVVDGTRFLGELGVLKEERELSEDRTLSHLLCDQIEFANVILLNKCDLITPEQRGRIHQWLSVMNANAKVLETCHSNVPWRTVIGTGLFSMKQAEEHPEWLQEARIGEHVPETLEYGISSFTYRSLRPFHPARLYETLQSMAGHAAPFDDVLRAKGMVWLCTRSELQGDFSLAGNHYVCQPGNPWWAVIDKSDWPEGLAEAIVPLWHEPYGDRQQEIVIIGQNSTYKDEVTKALDQCLLTDNEMEAGQDAWNEITDPFQESWDEAIETFLTSDQQHDHDHDHDHHHH